MVTQFNPGHAPFKSAESSAKCSTIFLKLCILGDVASLVVGWFQQSMIARGAAGGRVTPSEVRANYDRVILIGGLSGLITVITGILVLRWIYCAYRNLPSLGATDLRFTPRWAVGFFFFPILSLFRPFQAVTEIWKASNPDIVDPTGTTWKSQPGPTLLAVWWLTWLSSDILNVISTQFTSKPNWASLEIGSWLLMVSTPLNIVAAIFLIKIIKTVDVWQAKKIDRQNGGGMGYNYGAADFVPTLQAPGSARYVPATSYFSVRRVPVRLPSDTGTLSG